MNHGTGERRGDKCPVGNMSRRFQIMFMWIAMFQLPQLLILEHGATSKYTFVCS